MANSKKVKGWKARRNTMKVLQEWGYQVAVVERTGRFIKDKDMFGLFDLVAINPEGVKFIQVTCNKPHAHRKYKEFGKDFGFIVSVEQWVWIDRKGFDKYHYLGGMIMKDDNK